MLIVQCMVILTLGYCCYCCPVDNLDYYYFNYVNIGNLQSKLWQYVHCYVMPMKQIELRDRETERDRENERCVEGGYSALRKYSAPLNFATFCHISGFKHKDIKLYFSTTSGTQS